MTDTPDTTATDTPQESATPKEPQMPKMQVLAQFIKDASSETADVETYLFVKDNISKYILNIDIKFCWFLHDFFLIFFVFHILFFLSPF